MRCGARRGRGSEGGGAHVHHGRTGIVAMQTATTKTIAATVAEVLTINSVWFRSW